MMSLPQALSYADYPGSWRPLLGRGPSDLSLLLIHSPLGKTRSAASDASSSPFWP